MSNKEQLPSEIDFISVRANNFIAIGYDANNKTLFIKLTAISKKPFYNVPRDIYEGLLQSQEKDMYFEEKIRSKYRSV